MMGPNMQILKSHIRMVKHPFTTFYWYHLVAIWDVLTCFFGGRKLIYRGPATIFCVAVEVAPHLHAAIPDKPLCIF